MYRAVTVSAICAERAGLAAQRHGAFISHITDGKRIEVWRSHETSR
jgi:hypothetical protein